MTGFHGSLVGLFQVLLSFTSPQRQIALNSDVPIWECPTLASLVEKDHPQEVMLLRVINEDVGPTFPSGCVHWDWWIELKHKEREPKLPGVI